MIPFRALQILALCLCATGTGGAAEYFAAPGGSSTGSGSFEDPWDLATALKHPSVVKPMDTIWLRGGTYPGSYSSQLAGEPGMPIIVRQYPGERAVLDGALAPGRPTLSISGKWAWYWGFEVTNSRTDRRLEVAGSNPASGPGAGIDVYGPNTKLINLVVHDTGTAIGFWKPAVDAEIYGTLIFNNGWSGPDRSHGRAIYTQNEQGTKLIEDNIIFNQFASGLHLYGSPDASLTGYLIRRNVHFNGGAMVAGLAPADRIHLDSNYFFNDGVQFYYRSRDNGALTLTGNLFPAILYCFWWQRIRAEGNHFLGPGLIVRLAEGTSPKAHFLDGNIYYVKPGGKGGAVFSDADGKDAKAYSVENLRAEFGFEQHARLVESPTAKPQVPMVFLHRNKYEPNRANLVIYNWTRQDVVEVDVSAMNARPGDRYELRNAQNYFDEGVSGTIEGGTLKVRMTGWTIANPNGLDQPVKPCTLPEFGVFVLTVAKKRTVATRSAASLAPGPFAPGSIVSTFGQELAPAVLEDGTSSGPTGEVSVQVTDGAGNIRPAQLLYAAPGQVNYVLPEESSTGPALLQVRNGDQIVGEDHFLLSPVAPGLFSADGSGGGPAAGHLIQIRPDGSRTETPLADCQAGPCQPNPIPMATAPDDNLLVFYATGLRGRSSIDAVQVWLDSIHVPLLYAGPQPEFAGLDQVNVRLPRELAGRGPMSLVLAADGRRSNTLSVFLQ